MGVFVAAVEMVVAVAVAEAVTVVAWVFAAGAESPPVFATGLVSVAVSLSLSVSVPVVGTAVVCADVTAVGTEPGGTTRTDMVGTGV